MTHAMQWTAPAPLWPELLPAPGHAIGAFAQPALLRFASDSFMEDFLALLERNPSEMRGLIARSETWRGVLEQPQVEKVLEPEPKLAGQARQLKRLAVARQGLRFTAPAGGASPSGSGQPSSPLKLYQPAHQRYYLVASSLVCQVTGFPEHRPDPGKQERVGFVLRRLLPPGLVKPEQPLPAQVDETWDEYAFVVTPKGPGWRKIEQLKERQKLIEGEEFLPMFALAFREEDDRRRHLFAGMVPVGRREAYLGAPEQVILDPTAPDKPAGTRRGPGPKTARMALFRAQVSEPWKRLIELAFKTAAEVGESRTSSAGYASADKTIKATREQIQIGSWLILMEFTDYLQKYLPQEWERLQSATAGVGEPPLLAELRRIVIDNTMSDALVSGTRYTSAQVKRSLREALLEAAKQEVRDKLEAATGAYDRDDHTKGSGPQWPEFLFPLSDPARALGIDVITLAEPMLRWTAVANPNRVNDLMPADGVTPEGADRTYRLEEGNGAGLSDYLDSVDKLVALVVRAMPAETTEEVPAVPLAAQPLLDHRDGWFVIRCVFDRPTCGPLHEDVVSNPTQPFQLASFYDPQAPARPLRITLPLDTTPAGLRKFSKNTAFMISDILCGQIQRAKSMTFGDLVRSVLPWPLHKDLSGLDTSPCKSKAPELSVGMMCSLSIPIITVCAFVLLMIMVSLLDIIFRWIPWFITCFPLPGFKGKRQA